MPTVPDPNYGLLARCVNPYRQLPTRLRVLDGIAEQICEYLLEAEWICHDPYRLLGQRSSQQMAACLDLHLLRLNGVVHHQAQIDPLAVQLHLLIGTRARGFLGSWRKKRQRQGAAARPSRHPAVAYPQILADDAYTLLRFRSREEGCRIPKVLSVRQRAQSPQCPRFPCYRIHAAACFFALRPSATSNAHPNTADRTEAARIATLTALRSAPA